MYRGVLTKGVQVRYAFIKDHQSEHSTSLMCSLLSVAKSGFYKWLLKPKSNRRIQNELILKRIKYHFKESQDTYGSPRITMDLNEEGNEVSENRVARLMKLEGIALFESIVGTKRNSLYLITPLKTDSNKSLISKNK